MLEQQQQLHGCVNPRTKKHPNTLRISIPVFSLNNNNNYKPLFSNSCSSSSSSSSSPTISKSYSVKKSQKPKNPTPVVANKIRQRKFVEAKKQKDEKEGDASSMTSTVSSCKCKVANKSKCLCVAYNNLRKSQEELFKNWLESNDEEDVVENESVVSLAMKRSRERLMEEARESVPQSGSRKVMDL